MYGRAQKAKADQSEASLANESTPLCYEYRGAWLENLYKPRVLGADHSTFGIPEVIYVCCDSSHTELTGKQKVS
jgi:hypothetical protein